MELEPLEYRDGDCVRQIEAAVARPHRQSQARFRWKFGEHLRPQPVRLATEYQYVAFAITHIAEEHRGARREGKETPLAEARAAASPRRMHAHGGELVVVEPGAFQLAVAH